MRVKRRQAAGLCRLPLSSPKVFVVLCLAVVSGLLWLVLSQLLALSYPHIVSSIDNPPTPRRILLTTPERGTRAWTDVRGNLGPPDVVLNNRTTDWLKDRWQAASDMHGTAIRGSHWLRVRGLGHGGVGTRVDGFLLDWETAFAEDYRLEGWWRNQSVVTYFDAQVTAHKSLRSSESFGRSPGVKQKLPLHVIHKIACPPETTSTRVDELYLLIRKPFHGGWGVSLWRFQAFGYEETT